MDFIIAAVQVMYFPMLWRTLLVLGILGLGVALWTRQVKFLVYTLLLGLPLNMVVVVIYMLFFARFS